MDRTLYQSAYTSRSNFPMALIARPPFLHFDRETLLHLELSTARGELETDSPALENLLGRAPTSLVDAIRAARV